MTLSKNEACDNPMIIGSVDLPVERFMKRLTIQLHSPALENVSCPNRNIEDARWKITVMC